MRSGARTRGPGGSDTTRSFTPAPSRRSPASTSRSRPWSTTPPDSLGAASWRPVRRPARMSFARGKTTVGRGVRPRSAGPALSSRWCRPDARAWSGVEGLDVGGELGQHVVAANLCVWVSGADGKPGDVAVRITPLSNTDVDEMLRSLRFYRLLTGYRQSPPLDVAAFAELLHRVGQLPLAPQGSPAPAPRRRPPLPGRGRSGSAGLAR